MLQFSWVLAPFIAPVVLLPPILWVLLQNREYPRLSVETVMLLAAAAVFWSLSDAVRLAVVDAVLKRWLYAAYFVGAFVVIISLFAFAIDYSDHKKWRRPRRFVPLLAPFSIAGLLAIFNVGGLTFRNLRTTTVNGLSVLVVDWGPMFYVAHLAAYVAIAVSVFLFLSYERTNRHYRGQVASILAAAAVPWGLNAAYLLGLTQVNYTGAGFALSLPLASLMIFRYRILDIVPVARTAVVDQMQTGFLVLDYNGTVVDLNDRVCDILGVDTETLLGKSLRDLSMAYPAIGDAHNKGEHGTFSVEHADDTRHYQVDVSKVTDQAGEDRGSVILFQDVTELARARAKLRDRTAELEDQNERLEDFAHMLSHDLRNPLSIARGQLELARIDREDDERLEKVADAHARIDELIDDVLALARQGQAVTDPERLDLGTVAETAWENVDTGQATLQVLADSDVAADRSQLTQLFENLFRNAIQHGGQAVTVSIGDLPKGFYVEDDGPGIPEDERDKVLDKGYTTDADGTGMGLTIIQTAAEAHHWDVIITEGTDDGARFEFGGVAADPSQVGDDDDVSETDPAETVSDGGTRHDGQ